ncbi:MAG: hypothetical protein P1U77_19565, partial [Rubripirellula sp.]|nr:hypothetical protein [Rubripirellula sp.]
MHQACTLAPWSDVAECCNWLSSTPEERRPQAGESLPKRQLWHSTLPTKIQQHRSGQNLNGDWVSRNAAIDGT